MGKYLNNLVSLISVFMFNQNIPQAFLFEMERKYKIMRKKLSNMVKKSTKNILNKIMKNFAVKLYFKTDTL